MAEPIRVDLLSGALDGHYILLNKKAVTWGVLEDLQTGQHKLMMDAFARFVVGGDLAISPACGGEESDRWRNSALSASRPRVRGGGSHSGAMRAMPFVAPLFLACLTEAPYAPTARG